MAAQNALPPRIAIASYQILPLASDRPLPLRAHMTGPVRRATRHLQEQYLLHDPHSTKQYASPRPQAPARGPSMVCNDLPRKCGRASRSRVGRLLPRRDHGGPRGALSTLVAPSAISTCTGGTTARANSGCHRSTGTSLTSQMTLLAISMTGRAYEVYEACAVQ